jgi:hypothetical protein
MALLVSRRDRSTIPVMEASIREHTRQYFRHYPDYLFCRVLAENVRNGTTSHSQALVMLLRKAAAARENREEINRRLNQRTVRIGNRYARIKDLSLMQLMDQEDSVLKEVLEFYFKYPYAHRRTLKTRLLPRLIRTLPLSALLGHAKRRKIALEYDLYFDMLRLL